MWDSKVLMGRGCCMGHIYLITNKTNGKRYIGFTSKKDYMDRWREHVNFSRCKISENHSVKKMMIVKAIRKYGQDNFEVKSLVEDSDDLWLLNFVEPFLIAVLFPEYNSTKGGEGVLGHKHSDKTKRKCAMSMKGKKHSDVTRERMRKSAAGKKPCELAVKRAKEVFGHPVLVDGISFVSKNDAANYIKNKYGISRNTALRRIAKKSTNFSLLKQNQKQPNKS
jgi:group I intron endonuclease